VPARAARTSRAFSRETTSAAIAAYFTFILGLLATHKLGLDGLLALLVAVVLVILLFRPLLTMVLVVGLTIICEGPTFGLFTFTDVFYGSLAKDISILDAFVGLAVLSVAVDVIRRRRPLWVPGPLRLPLMLLALAMIGSVIMSHAAGTSLHLAILAEDTLAYLLFLPIAVANLEIDKRQLRYLLFGAIGLALVKAMLGLVELASGHGLVIEGIGGLTYYEPAANWIIMVTLFAILAAVIMRVKVPMWLLIGGAVLFISLLLSYRRSFWIAALVGIALVVLLGLAPRGRRVLLPVALAMVAGIWGLSTINFQSQSPIFKRAVSLEPTAVQANASDRYRIDERVNVWANILEHPITGLGMTTPWKALVRPQAVESVEGRQYVHFAVLYYWVKLGILGLLAYLSILIGSSLLAWRAWQYNHSSMLGVFGLASLCGIAGLVVIDTTATFTGGDQRFTVLFAVQVGLLALAAKIGESSGARRDAPTGPLGSQTVVLGSS
jgi:O-antigen ligase